MSDRKEEMMVKVRKLLERAEGTPFEHEADTCRRMADDIMLKYAIEMHELAKGTEASRKAARRDLDFSWYYNYTIPHAVRSALYSMFLEVMEHCRVYPVTMKIQITRIYQQPDEAKVPVFGNDADIDYADLLFTNLWLQMSGKLLPKYDPNKSLGENVYNAKEAGMKYKDIAKWVGHPEWVTYDHRGRVTAVSSRLITAMKKYARENGLTVHKEVNLDSYVRDYSYSYASSVAHKLRVMREEQGQSTGSMALALRDMRDLAKEAAYDEWPDLRPHPADCDCDRCHYCEDPNCQRKRCKDRRALKPSRGRGSQKVESFNYTAMARGRKAGAEAKIVGRGGEGLRRQDELKP